MGTARQTRSLLSAYVLIGITAVFARLLSWPGMITQDSVFVTMEAISGQHTTYHPLLNGLLMRALVVPFGTYAVLTSIQIGLAALLFARAATLVDRARPTGAGSWLPLATVGIWMLSLHTWLYMGMVWKDVLSGYAVAYLVAHVYHARASSPEPGQIGWIDAILFGGALVLATKLRHGMEINFVLVPLLMGPKVLFASKRLRNGYLAALAVAVVISALSSSSFVRQDPKQRLHKARLTTTVAAQPFLGIVSNRNGYTSDDYEYDRRLAERVFGPFYKQEYAPDYSNNDVQIYDPVELEQSLKAIMLRTPRLCMLNVAQCLSGRIQMMLATLQPSTTRGSHVFYDVAVLPCSSFPAFSPEVCSVIDQYAREGKPALSASVESAVMSGPIGTGQHWGNLYFWNMLPALGVVLLALLALSPRHPLWLASAFTCAQMLLPFVTATANDFRYYYFLWLAACLLAPVLAYELCARAASSKGGMDMR